MHINTQFCVLFCTCFSPSPLQNVVIPIKKLTLIQHYLVIHKTHSDFTNFPGNFLSPLSFMVQDPNQDRGYRVFLFMSLQFSLTQSSQSPKLALSFMTFTVLKSKAFPCVSSPLKYVHYLFPFSFKSVSFLHCSHHFFPL